MRPMLKASIAELAITAAPADGVLASSHQISGNLKIFLDTSNPVPRATMEAMIARFQERHPGLSIETTVIDREEYKTQIRNFLTANPPNVNIWYAANRMCPYVKAGLVEDVSDLWNEPEIANNLASTKRAMTIDGKQWGVYYRKDIYEKLGLEEPSDWAAFKENCRKIVDSGRACFTIATKFLWTADGWFDYLNMRTNGFDFHMRLAAGEESWESDEVRATFANWKELIDNHQTYSWQEALPFMVNGEAAGYLMGNFAVVPLRDAGLADDQLDFFQFPPITNGIALSEDAPTDTFHIPVKAANKEAAKEFLCFVVSADEQTVINNGANLGQLPINAMSSVDDDKFLREGFAMLSSNNLGGFAQFWDRDAPAEMAKVSMEGFQSSWPSPATLIASFPNRIDLVNRDGAPPLSCGKPAPRSQAHEVSGA